MLSQRSFLLSIVIAFQLIGLLISAKLGQDVEPSEDLSCNWSSNSEPFCDFHLVTNVQRVEKQGNEGVPRKGDKSAN